MAGLTSAEIVERINSDEEVMAKIWKVIGLAKVPEIVPYCGDLMRDGPLLLGCWHRDVMTEYEQAFKAMGKRVIQVNGDTPASQISQIRNDFNAGNIDCIIGQMRKMGVSWNLQEACSNVVIAEIHPSPSMLEQFYKRVYRFGQKRPVQVDIILSTTNVDEALDGVQMRKATSDAKINQ
jgi:SNF2 family DNA or RNA helicase